MQAYCTQPEDPSGAWLDLQQGFLVPVDEITDVAVVGGGPEEADGSDGSRRADFVHVRAGARGPLEFRFIEVKHRLHLKTARQPELLSSILRQTGDLRRRWHGYFFADNLKPVERSRLARILWFYADRAARHRLAPQAHDRLRREIDQLVLKEAYRPVEIDQPDIGYIFCPEHRAGRPEPLYVTDGEAARLWLFGPSLLPEERAAAVEVPPPAPEIYEISLGAATPEPQQASAKEHSATETATPEGSPPLSVNSSKPRKERRPAAGSATPTEAPVDIVLGSAAGGNDEVSWRVSIRANPHLMIVGLPGMGKTTCLINICRQLNDSGIAPVVFSYHDDIDDKLRETMGDLKLVDYDGLGFNPLRVDAPQPTAHVDVAGTLRDIFAAIFPDLGDLQLEELRQAIKQSYADLGWGDRSTELVERAIPKFGAFLDILTSKPKPNLGLLARLRELAGYGFFENTGDGASLLDEVRPTIVRIHGTTNGMLQNAFSSFVLYSLYKDMKARYIRGGLGDSVVKKRLDDVLQALLAPIRERRRSRARDPGYVLQVVKRGTARARETTDATLRDVRAALGLFVLD